MTGLFDLTSRVAIVTGGNGGIGLGMARGLVQAGATVSIWGRNREKNEAARQALAGPTGDVETRLCDVTDRADVERAFGETLAAQGRVDGCFANAGIGGGGRRSFLDRTEAEWRRMFATNLDGTFHVFQLAGRHMKARAEGGDPYGRLIATSSMAALFGTAGNEHYAGSKAALNALVRALAVELARWGVTANAVLPGWIRSDMTAGLMESDKFVGNVLPRTPLRRFGEAEDFAGIAVYLMSRASAFHTGDTIVIDGGYSAF